PARASGEHLRMAGGGARDVFLCRFKGGGCSPARGRRQVLGVRAGSPRRVESIPKDVQSERVANGFRLNKVGVTGVVKPVQIRRPNRAVTLTTTLDLFVDLPQDQKGSHLSRTLEAINEVVDRSLRDPAGSLEDLTDVV